VQWFYRACWVASLFILQTAVSAAETKSPITHETLWRMKQVGAPTPSPDGRWVVFSVGEPAYDEQDELSDLWLVPGDGSAPPKRWTTAKGTESSPAWNPDGTRIAFSAKREGDEVAQIYLLDLSGGEARRLTQSPVAARTPKWSPDGKLLLYQSSVYPGATNDVSNRRIADERKKAKSKVRVYEGFPIRRWDKWLDDTQTHLHVISADGSGQARDVLAGTVLVSGPGFRGALGEGAGDTLEPVWASDSQSIVFTATTNAHTAAYAESVSQLYQVSLAGGEPRALTSGDASHSHATFSPDGRWLGFLVNSGEGVIYSLDRLAVAPWPWTGSIQPLAKAFDRSVGSYSFSTDSRTIYFSAEDSGRIQLWSVPIDGGEPRLAIERSQGVWLSMTIPPRAATPVLYGHWETATQPAEVFRVDLTSGTSRRLTEFNVVAAAALDWQPLREFWFTNRVGRRIHSYLALPSGFDESKKYPVFALIHGGHALMWRDALTRRWNYHLIAQPGYVVLLTDYVGSTGYGEKFTLDILGDPLRGPAEDINAAVDEALRRYPFLDSRRQAAGGASYGGHLANWLQATTTRYRCLVGHAGLASLYSQWATSDAIYHREVMMGGPFWEKTAAWLDQSPATYAKDFKTPMLLSIGETDYRVPLNNTLEMWSLLQRQKVPSRLLLWPDEKHLVLKG
jgi:dipeptidyl aminopeptidase/acylaminoacyl peptidase